MHTLVTENLGVSSTQIREVCHLGDPLLRRTNLLSLIGSERVVNILEERKGLIWGESELCKVSAADIGLGDVSFKSLNKLSRDPSLLT